MDRWLSAIGLGSKGVHAFRHNHISRENIAEDVSRAGLLSMGEQHELQRVLGIQSYGHRLLFLTEIRGSRRST